MKRCLVMLKAGIVAVALTGCASSGDLAKVQAHEGLIDAKADQALREAQAAKATADEAKLQSDAAAVRAENAEKAAQEREKIAEEKERRADAIFEHSMKK